MINKKTYHELLTLKDIEEGQLAVVEENHTVYEYKDKKWSKKDLSANGEKLTLYGLNKLIIPQMPTLTEETIEKKKEIINEFVEKVKGSYYMLLGRELNYYTFFAINSKAEDRISNELIDCLSNLGEIKSIDLVCNNDEPTLECWVCDENKNASVLYFFDWTEGTIECQ